MTLIIFMMYAIQIYFHLKILGQTISIDFIKIIILYHIRSQKKCCLSLFEFKLHFLFSIQI